MKFMYTLKVNITPATAISILQQAEYYQVNELVKQARKEIEKEYLPKHVICLLRDSVKFRISDVIGNYQLSLCFKSERSSYLCTC